MKKTISKIAMTASILLSAQSSFALTNLDVVVCYVARGTVIEKIVYFSKTKNQLANHVVEYQITGKTYQLTAQEENSQDVNGIVALRLDVLKSTTTPDTTHTDNLRFSGTAGYTNVNYRDVVRIQSPTAGLMVGCSEQSSHDLQRAYPGTQLELIP